MPHYTDKDMTYEEFSKLLKDRFDKGESTDDYSYKSNIKHPFTYIIVDDAKHNSQIDYSEFFEKVKTIIEDQGLRVVIKQVIVEESIEDAMSVTDARTGKVTNSKETK